MTWSHDMRWVGDPKPIRREIRTQMAHQEETAKQVAAVLKLRPNAFYRRLNGNPKWRWWELEDLASHWGIKVADLTGENSVTHKTDIGEP